MIDSACHSVAAAQVVAVAQVVMPRKPREMGMVCTTRAQGMVSARAAPGLLASGRQEASGSTSVEDIVPMGHP